MHFDQIKVRKMVMPLKTPFETSFGTIKDRTFLIIEIHKNDKVGYAEVVTEAAPLYNEECIGSANHIIESYLIPLLQEKATALTHPQDITQLFKPFKRNLLAKSGIESAFWDLFGKQQNRSLASILGGKKKEIECGISIGIQEDTSTLINMIYQHVEEGYKRIKLKIKPGHDISIVDEVRSHFPDLPLMVDANSAYTLQDLEIFKQLDQYNLMMIEQPLAHDDIIDHSVLQREVETSICLDESIHNVDDVRKALHLGSCKIINIKIGRVGGLTEAKAIHDYCLEKDVPVWCGGMLEAGIGRAHNLAITTLPNFTIPGDTSPSSRYWHEDILVEPIEFTKPGIMQVSENAGIGYEVDLQKLNYYTDSMKTFKNTN